MLPGMTGSVAFHRGRGHAYGSADNAPSVAGSVYTFAGMSFSTATADRFGYVFILNQDAAGVPGSISGVTIGGQVAYSSATVTAGSSGALRLSLYVTDQPLTTGTTADVVVTLTSADTFVYAWSGALYGISTGTPSATYTDATGASYSGSITHTYNGVSIAGYGFWDGGGSPTVTWASGLTSVLGTPSSPGSGVDFDLALTNPTPGGSTTVSASDTAGDTNNCLIVAAYY